MVTIDGVDDPKDPRKPDCNSTEGIWVRIPRPVAWKLWRREIVDNNETAILVREGITDVLDHKCQHTLMKFRRSAWARRSTKLEFAESGALKSFASVATSTAAAATAALRDVSVAVPGGLEQACKLSNSWYSVRDARTSHELAQLKEQVELKEQQLKAARLAATDDQCAKLLAINSRSNWLTRKLPLTPLPKPPSNCSVKPPTRKQFASSCIPTRTARRIRARRTQTRDRTTQGTVAEGTPRRRLMLTWFEQRPGSSRAGATPRMATQSLSSRPRAVRPRRGYDRYELGDA